MAVVAAVAVPLLLLLGYLAWGEVDRDRFRIQQEALGQARILGAQVERHLTARLDALAAAAAALGASGASPGVIDAQARRLRQTFPDIERLLFVDELGLVLAAVPSGGEIRRSGTAEQAWFKEVVTATEPRASDAFQQGPRILVSLAAPARAPEGQLRGAIAADVSLGPVQDLLARAGLAAGGVAELLSDRGIVLARHPSLFLMRRVGDLPGYEGILHRPGGIGSLVFEDGETRLIGTAPVRPAGWVLAVGFPPTHGAAQSRRRLAQVGVGALAVSVLGVALAMSIARRQVEGMSRLRGAMRRLEAGELPPAVPVAVGGDMGKLTTDFNRMLTWLHGKLREYEVLSQVEAVTGTAISGERSADSMLPGLLRRVVAGMGADAGVVLVPEDGGGTVARASVGLTGITVEGVQLRRGRGLAAAVLTERQVVAVTDVAGDYLVEEPFIREAGLRSVIAAPILSGDELLGILELGYRLPRSFGTHDRQRLETVARRMAQALEHARAVDAVRQNTAGLEAQLAQQLAALQEAAAEQAETRRQAQESHRKAQELEQTLKRQAAEPPRIREVIVEKEVVREREVVRVDPAASAELRAAMQRTVSQELRAPLTALLDLPRLLVEGLDQALREDERQQLEILRDHGAEILELIDDLVILSGLEAGQVKILKSAFDLPALVGRMVRTLQPRAAAKGNGIDVDVKLGVGQMVSDSKRVEQIVSNLLLNAIRYTEVGEIRVTCFVRDAEVVLTVADDGAGFSNDEQARIFEPFLPVGPRDGRAFPGTGLSLTVCQRLTEALGGKIRVESEIDRGTWFTVSLPIQS